jgi:exopolysaccharide biosynthesis polyprenyl glycosylphosphotransferase
MVLIGALYLSYRDVSRLQMLYFATSYLGLITLHRGAIRVFFRLIGRHRFDSRRVLMVGTGTLARQVAQVVQDHSWTGIHLVGFVDSGSGGAAERIGGIPVVGQLMDTPEVVQQYQADEVVIALPSEAQDSATDLILGMQTLPVNLRIVPDYFDLAFLQLRVEDFGGLPLLCLKEPTLSPYQRLAKRAFDLFVTSLTLLPALPLMGIIALAVRLDSRGPIIFAQERLGEGGRPFGMLKFRSMTGETSLGEIAAGEGDDDPIALHKRPNDPRVTGVGRLLRRSSLDELPQLFNVLKGEMSLVGPRPEMPWLVDKYETWQRKRFDVPQGITGWWQVNGRSDKPMYLHTEEDLFYIRNYSIGFDLKILWRTIGAVLGGRGAY